ncbi:MAG: ABC transporter ATP-binding protein [Pseudomonadota bacterium]
MAFLELDRVSKTFTDGAAQVEAVTPTTLSLERGAFVTFLGPSGCGKTTLMRLIGGLDTASGGEIRLEGERLGGPDRRRGMVFQSYAAFTWLTVEGNVRFGLRYRTGLSAAERTEIVSDLIDLIGLRGFEESYTNRISGGMRQRVAIARTLAADPDVLLMDEPFGALDALTRERLQAELLTIARREEKTTIFVTHDVEEALLLADRLIVFSARPARVVRDVDVTAALGRARSVETRDAAPFLALRRQILADLRGPMEAAHG